MKIVPKARFGNILRLTYKISEMLAVPLINAISVWNTVYLTEATKVLKEKGTLREDLLKHISPLGWEHINFLGEYTFDKKNVTNLDSLRPLLQ